MPSLSKVHDQPARANLSVGDCAKLVGRSPSWVRDQIQCGTLQALKVRSRYLVTRASMDALIEYLRQHRKANSRTQQHLRLVVDNTVRRN